jgi:hypothetical protein
MNRPFLAAALLGGTLTLAGCGDNQSAPSSTALEEVDACALLTVTEIEEATGIVPAAPEDLGGASGPPMCSWAAADGSHPTFVSITVAPSDNYETFDAAMAEWQKSAEAMDFPFDPAEYEEVEGPGDVNAWLREMGMLQAHSGNRMVQVYAPKVAPDRDKLQASIALARHAWGRLE